MESIFRTACTAETTVSFAASIVKFVRGAMVGQGRPCHGRHWMLPWRSQVNERWRKRKVVTLGIILYFLAREVTRTSRKPVGPYCISKTCKDRRLAARNRATYPHHDNTAQPTIIFSMLTCAESTVVPEDVCISRVRGNDLLAASRNLHNQSRMTSC